MPTQGSPTNGGPLLRFPLVPPEIVRKRKEHDEQIAALQKKIQQARADLVAARAHELLADADKYLVAASEYRRRPSEANADISAFAGERKLDGAVLSRWVKYVDAYAAPDLSRTLLATPRRTVHGIVGLDAWTGPTDQPPSMLANATDRVITLGTVTVPPRCVMVHPGPRSGVAVGWRSPISGKISVRGKVTDADAMCGNGIDWAIDHVADGALQRLAAGAFPNGGKQDFADARNASSLLAIDVHAGDFVQVAVYPKGDYSCDSTVVDLEIAEVGPTPRAWNLTRDILPDVLADGKGNPHADSMGNPAVWQFYEVPDEKPVSPMQPGSALAKWAAASSGSSGSGASGGSAASNADAVREASIAIRDALMSLESQAKQGNSPDQVSADGDATLYHDLVNPAGPFWNVDKAGDEILTEEAKQQLAELKKELAILQKPLPALPECEGLTESGIPGSVYAGIGDTRIHIRGRHDRLGDPTPRHFPRLLAGDTQPPITQGSGRVELARFLTDPANPLTARVMVNRLWQHHFGEGIVRTPNNYGKLGRPPTHPELLDWLAIEFVQKGWSIKTLHREIMLSSTYQQSSVPDPATFKADPDDLLFGWVKRRRLEAESIRDSLLTHAGTLDDTLGGPAIRDANTRRRTLYLMTIRSLRSDYRTLFDAADASAIVDQRIDSTVAPQALFLLNNPFVLDRAEDIARRALAETSVDDRGRIDWLYRRLYARPASDREITIGLQLLKESQATAQDGTSLSREAAWKAYCQVLVCANEFVYVD